ncbi:hypothetical protein VB774_23505 [Pseudanabaena galeata UHCC 0370]|uniref:Helicase XPB/Ssl2 N-terminal domain-containing protein n=1 Tax=Pseudanabaena galeata UHCC 0370 TaxID=3110310 RepID=A0ABU5TR86_9CYAN|nr:hypothetical protein [Pseudanabaena galeata]MEA5480612.1 hypothetical protein [Pseudanabaena galeata UHCC 0370]
MPRKQIVDIIATIQQALETQTVDNLKKFCALLSNNLKLTRKADLVTAILPHLEGKKLQKIWQQLDELQKAAVAEVVHSAGNDYRADAFVAKYGQKPNFGKGDRYSYAYQPSLLSLFFYQGVMPSDLKQNLKAFVPKPKATRLTEIKDTIPDTLLVCQQKYWNDQEYEVPLTICEMEQVAQKDLLSVLRLIQSGKVSVSDKTSLPSGATVKAIATILLGGDFYDDQQRKAEAQYTYTSPEDDIGGIKAFAWTSLLQVGNMAELAGKKLVLTKAGLKAMQEPPAKTLQTLWKRWLKNTTFDEFRRIDEIKGQTGKGARGMTAVAGRREVIANALSECPIGKWTEFRAFSKYMVATGQLFEVTRDPYNLYICEFGYGNLGYDGSHDWHILQERYMRCLLFEYAATLGLIDVGYVDPGVNWRDFSDLWGAEDLNFLSRYDGLIYFRLNALGSYCLGLTDQYQPTAIAVSQTLRILPNLEIVASGSGLNISDALVLDLYAQRIADTIWRLDSDRLLTAIEDGQQIAELKQVLEQNSSEPLPESVQEFLSNASDKATSLRDLGEAKLIECTSSHLATLIANDPLTKKYCQLVGSRALVVLATHEGKFRKALRQIGYALPTVR